MSINCTMYSLQRSSNLYKGDYNKMHSSEHKTINAYFACATKIGVGHTILNQWYPTEIYGTKKWVCHYIELVMSTNLYIRV